ncbi:MAG: polysaccharide deacetylase family protein [Firmicutes bacterium]|nr:polysaccharide deacetylase family protein [Bacillota bacterium]
MSGFFPPSARCPDPSCRPPVPSDRAGRLEVAGLSQGRKGKLYTTMLTLLTGALLFPLLSGCALSPRDPPPLELPMVVQDGVTLAAFDLSGAGRPEIEDLLDKLASLYDSRPVEARLDPVTHGVIPELRGRRLLREANVLAALSAPSGAALSPLFEEIVPDKTMAMFPEAPVYQANPARREVSFCINVAWGEENLPSLLDLLEEQRVEVTFFLQGSWIKKNPALARQLAASRHELANHTLTHPHLNQLSEAAIRQELQATEALLSSLGGRTVPYFAPPYGEFNPVVLKAASSLRLRTVLWTVDTVDWKRPGPEVIVRRVLDRLTGGAIILMHPTEQTGQAMGIMIPALRQHGYRIVHLSRLLSPYPLDPKEASP